MVHELREEQSFTHFTLGQAHWNLSSDFREGNYRVFVIKAEQEDYYQRYSTEVLQPLYEVSQTHFMLVLYFI
jgi:hypothetical protein